MNDRLPKNCPDCDASLDRRTFMKTVGSAALIGAAGPALLSGRFASAAPTTKSAAETLAAKFYATLSEEQKKLIAFPFDHDLRKKINANWQITKVKLDADFYTKEQGVLVEEIVKKVTTEDGYDRISKQMQDDSGGIGDYSVAVFGTPESGKFEFELTGRHLTLRADGDSVDKAAFGGPIIYGHGAEGDKPNLFTYQTTKVNEVFKALDPKQAAKALISTKAPVENQESNFAIRGDGGSFVGVPVSELSADQKKLVEATLKTILAPYRKEDVDEVFEILKATGGVDKLNLAFYQEGDIGQDKVWDIWRVEGPAFVWHFRGFPHVHAYVNIGMKS